MSFMKSLPLLAISLAFCLGLSVGRAAPPPSAEEVLAKAGAKAGAEHKAIFLHFGASWCGWCKRLDAYLDQPEVKPVFEKYFVPVTLVVQENEKHKDMENAGGDAVATRFGGTAAGLPFIALLDASGKLLVNSRPGGTAQNIGYPGKPQEVDWFVKMLRQAAPQMTAEDLKTLETPLRKASQ